MPDLFGPFSMNTFPYHPHANRKSLSYLKLWFSGSVQHSHLTQGAVKSGGEFTIILIILILVFMILIILIMIMAYFQVSLPRTRDSSLIQPPSIVNGIAVSKTFQILYRNEEVTFCGNIKKKWKIFKWNEMKLEISKTFQIRYRNEEVSFLFKLEKKK